MAQKLLQNEYWRECAGPGLHLKTEKCLVHKDGWHQVLPAGDTKPYNGVKTWRCPTCFGEHRRRVAESRK